MSSKAKKIFLALSIIVPFLLYCVYYYGMVFKNAPYKFTEFKSLVFKYGVRDSLVNSYNSETGVYQYLNNRDSLVKKQVFLKKSELLYLHRKASDLGFWNFPANETTADSTNHKGVKPTRFVMQFNYQRKSKTITFDENFDGPQKLVEANTIMLKEIQSVLNEAEQRQKK